MIHAIVYTVVGIVVALYSLYVDPDKLKLFLWVGVGFFVFGIVRLAMDHMKKPKKRHQPRSAKGFCYNCGAALHEVQNFCHNCGQKIFRNR